MCVYGFLAVHYANRVSVFLLDGELCSCSQTLVVDDFDGEVYQCYKRLAVIYLDGRFKEITNGLLLVQFVGLYT